MDPQTLAEQAKALADQTQSLAALAADLAQQAQMLGAQGAMGQPPLIMLFAAFVLACFVGFLAAQGVASANRDKVKGALGVVASSLVVAAILAASPGGMSLSKILGLLALCLASEVLFGCAVASQRWLASPKDQNKTGEEA
ncbi:putative NAD(P) transhydrogenase subunit alpha part 2 [Rhodospirillaceae bacterium LM-1]|nr:putative NAD(P) transhydrogenase subunit alpha part 2 [Rhodospirillaceae bacterium LM-1]